MAYKIDRFYNFIKRDNINKLIEKLYELSSREYGETKILFKIIINSLKHKDRPNESEINFLKKHSLDLLKILLFLMTWVFPIIPYLPIVILLRKIGIDLLPSINELDIPEGYIEDDITKNELKNKIEEEIRNMQDHDILD